MKDNSVIVVRHNKQTRLKKFQRNLQKQLAGRSKHYRTGSATERITQTLGAVKVKRGRLKRKQIS